MKNAEPPIVSVMESHTPKKIYQSFFDTPRRSPRKNLTSLDPQTPPKSQVQIDFPTTDGITQLFVKSSLGTPKRSPRMCSPNAVGASPSKVSRIARKLIEDSPTSDSSPHLQSPSVYKRPKNPMSSSEIQKLLDAKVHRVKKRSRSVSTESSRSNSFSSKHTHSRPPSKKKREGINKGVGHGIRKYVPPSASKLKAIEQKAKSKVKPAKKEMKTYVVTRKTSSAGKNESPTEKRFFRGKPALSDMSDHIVQGFGKNTVLRLKYVNVEKTPEKIQVTKGLPVFDQKLEERLPNVESALARLFGEDSPNSAKQTPTRSRPSPRKLFVQMGEGLARSSENTPVRRSPRKLASDFLSSSSVRELGVQPLNMSTKLNRSQLFPVCGGKEHCDLPNCSTCLAEGRDEENHGHIVSSQMESALKYTGFKRERVVGQFANEYVIQVLPGDPYHFRRKVNDVLKVVDAELGFPESTKEEVERKRVFLYITEKRVVGCLVAEPLDVAHPVVHSPSGAIECSETTRPVKVGVSRIWTLASHRRKRVASRMVSCLRAQFQFGGLLKHDDVAFSSPTMDGAMFARKYMKKDDYLVYQREI